MPYCHTQALVLRRADYREHDRVLSLLTPHRGKVDVLARGCRKPKSPLLSCSELFALGDYVLYQGKGHEIVSACQVQESYYPLREDIRKLSYAAILLAAADQAAQPEQEQEHLMILLTRSLHRLAYGDWDAKAVTAAFLLHFASLQGYKPRLKHCAVCERPLAPGEGAWLDPQAGGLVCRQCPRSGAAMPLSGDTINWLSDVLALGIEKTGASPQEAPVKELKRYVEAVLDRRLPQLPDSVPGL